MSEEIRDLFTQISPTYDRLNHVLSFNIDKKWRKKTIHQIRFSPKQSFEVLDLCAGTLDLTLACLKKYPAAKITALDFSQKMLDHGYHKIPASMKENVHIVCGDALSLPFDNASFDVIFCGYGFRNLDDQVKGLKEIHRVLKPNGQLLILEFFRPQNFFTKTFHKTYGKVLLPTIGALISGNSKAYRYLNDSIINFYSVGECKKMFEQNGFKSVESKNFFGGVSSLITGLKQ